MPGSARLEAAALAKMAADAPGCGLHFGEAMERMGLAYPEFRKVWGLAYGAGWIDMCAGYIVMPARYQSR